ncbi:hypothetical protein RIF29_23663 [Crotalaria pallida]|uniref:Uncharacterized protein n=1 Tax=Crotalaria pallida TaxID=3830 RepID=A0AAN9F8G8_CROPI
MESYSQSIYFNVTTTYPLLSLLLIIYYHHYRRPFIPKFQSLSLCTLNPQIFILREREREEKKCQKLKKKIKTLVLSQSKERKPGTP